VVKFSRNGVPLLEIAIPPPYVVATPPGDVYCKMALSWWPHCIFWSFVFRENHYNCCH